MLLRKSIETFLSQFVCHIQVSVTLMTVLTDEFCSFSLDLSSADTAYGTDLLLLDLCCDNSLLPAFVFQFFTDGFMK